MKALLTILVITCWIISGWGQNYRFRSFSQARQKSIKAYQAKKYRLFLVHATEAFYLYPQSNSARFTLAKAYLLNGKNKQAMNILLILATVGYKEVISIKKQPIFASLERHPRYSELMRKINLLKRQITHSQVAFRIPEKDLIPEGIAFDKKTKTFYIGSIEKQKIIQIDAKGQIRDFITSRQDGIKSVLGMEVDPVHRHLWVASYQHPHGETSAIFKYNLNNGVLIKKYPFVSAKGKKQVPTLFNDLTLNADGDVFTTNANTKEVYWINHQTDRLKVLMRTNKNYIYPNGIALSDDGKYLFVVAGMDIEVNELATGKSWLLKHTPKISLEAIDGLSFYKNTLIAHQFNYPGESITQFKLDASFRKVVAMRRLETQNPLIDAATTGELAHDGYYYIANAQLSKYDQKNQLDKSKLKEVVILKIKYQDLEWK